MEPQKVQPQRVSVEMGVMAMKLLNWSLTIRRFSIISRTFDGSGAVGVFYCPSRYIKLYYLTHDWGFKKVKVYVGLLWENIKNY